MRHSPNSPAWRRPNPVFSDEYRAIVSVLVDARRAAGLSQRDLAARLAKTSSHVCRIERGQRRVDTLELCRIASAVGLPPTVLFERIVRAIEPYASADQAELHNPPAPKIAAG